MGKYPTPLISIVPLSLHRYAGLCLSESYGLIPMFCHIKKRVYGHPSASVSDGLPGPGPLFHCSAWHFTLAFGQVRPAQRPGRRRVGFFRTL